MAKEPEKKSIYANKLKDVNKDGKRNFKDTWLGDALGFDGKIGTQGPGLGASLKGARREMGGGSAAPAPTRPKERPVAAKKEPTASVGGKSLKGKVAPKSTGPTTRRAEVDIRTNIGPSNRAVVNPKAKPLSLGPKTRNQATKAQPTPIQNQTPLFSTNTPDKRMEQAMLKQLRTRGAAFDKKGSIIRKK